MNFWNDGKIKLITKIDENVYNDFVRLIKEERENTIDEAIEQLMRNYVANAEKINAPEPESKRQEGYTHYANEEDIEFIAYCFSNYEHYSLYPSLNQGEAFEKAAKLLNVKVKTLRNRRDEFDGNYRNIPFDKKEERKAIGRRVGWKKPLSELQTKIKNQWDTEDKQTVIARAKQILSKYADYNRNCNFEIEENSNDSTGLIILIEKWLRKKTAPYNVIKSYFAIAEKHGVNGVTQERMQRYAFNELHENNFQPNFSSMKNGNNSVSAYRIFELSYHPSWGNRVALTNDAKDILLKYKNEFLK